MATPKNNAYIKCILPLKMLHNFLYGPLRRKFKQNVETRKFLNADCIIPVFIWFADFSS